MAAAEHTPAAWLFSRPIRESNTLVLALKGRIDPDFVPILCDRARTLLETCDASQVVCDVGGLIRPDAVAVDALARLQLTARRLGRRVALRDAGEDLQGLLELMGVAAVLPTAPGLSLEPWGQAEEREQPRGVEEEADPGDRAV